MKRLFFKPLDALEIKNLHGKIAIVDVVDEIPPKAAIDLQEMLAQELKTPIVLCYKIKKITYLISRY